MSTATANGTATERLKTIVTMVREGGFAVFAVLLLGVVCWQQRSNSGLQAETVRALEDNTSAISALKTELRELRLTRSTNP